MIKIRILTCVCVKCIKSQIFLMKLHFPSAAWYKYKLWCEYNVCMNQDDTIAHIMFLEHVNDFQHITDILSHDRKYMFTFDTINPDSLNFAASTNFRTNITHITIKNTRLSSIAPIESLLLHSVDTLQMLHIQSTVLTFDVQSLADIMPMSQLSHLTIRTTSHDVIRLVYALESTHTLVFLNISMSDITDDDVKQLAALNFGNVRTLCMVKCGITMISPLLRVVPYNRFNKLDFRGNLLKRQEIDEAIATILHCPQLEYIKMDGLSASQKTQLTRARQLTNESICKNLLLLRATNQLLQFKYKTDVAIRRIPVELCRELHKFLAKANRKNATNHEKHDE